MKKAYLIASMLDDKESIPLDGDLFGVDLGAYFLAKRGFKMLLAIGDFDSVNDEQLKLIRKSSFNTLTLKSEKQETDTEAALIAVLDYGYDNVVILGGLGGRVDHTFANLMLVARYAHKNVTLMDSNNSIRAYKTGRFPIARGDFKYFSIYAMEPSRVTMPLAKYPLSFTGFLPLDIYGTSNELIEENTVLEVHRGLILFIQSKDANKKII